MKKRTETHKKIAAVVIAAGFVIVQECFVLMYLCIRGGYTATAAWLTAAVGLAEAVIGVGAQCYFSLAKSDHSEGGITFEAAKAKGFKQGSIPTPLQYEVDMVEIICAAIAGLATIIAAATSVKTSRITKRTEARAERRAHESRLAMELMYATCALSLTTAKKLAGMHTNGDVEDAMKAAEHAQQEYISFVRDEAAAQFTKI